VRIVFRACVCQKWIDLRQTKTKMIASIFQYISPAEIYFCAICQSHTFCSLNIGT